MIVAAGFAAGAAVVKRSELRLAAERRDTSGDGRFDDVQHYDSEGLIRLREEDVDSDGRVDVRTAYSRGRIVRREIMSPDSSVRVQ